MLSQLLDGVRYVYRNPLVLPSISLDLVLILVSSVMAVAAAVGGYFLFPTLRRMDRITDSTAQSQVERP